MRKYNVLLVNDLNRPEASIIDLAGGMAQTYRADFVITTTGRILKAREPVEVVQAFLRREKADQDEYEPLIPVHRVLRSRRQKNRWVWYYDTGKRSSEFSSPEDAQRDLDRYLDWLGDYTRTRGGNF